MNIKFLFDKEPVARTVQFYCSFTNKEPSEHNHTQKKLLAIPAYELKEHETWKFLAPDEVSVLIKGQFDNKTGHQKFYYNWVYVTLIWDQENIQRIDILPQLDYEKVKKQMLAALQGDANLDVHDDHDDHGDEDICMHNFSLGDGTRRIKQLRLERFVKKLVDDDYQRFAWDEKLEDIVRAKEQENKDIVKNRKAINQDLEKFFHPPAHYGHIDLFQSVDKGLKREVEKSTMVKRNVYVASNYNNYKDEKKRIM